MSVGLMDGDFSTYLLVPFNLEIMKLSTYYKKKREIVVLSKDFEPNYYTKFIYRKDYTDQLFPKGLMTTSNVEYGGLAFSNNIYIPLPREIEICKPDTSIYSRFERQMKQAGTYSLTSQIYKNLSDAEHCRLSLDGKTIWPEYGKQFRNLRATRHLILHDYDLGKVEGSFEEVQKILKLARNDGWATRVGMKFPIQLSDGKDLVNWSTIRTDALFYSIQFNGLIDDDSFYKWFEKCRDRAAYKQMEYNATWGYEADDFVINILPKIYRQIIISRSCHLKFSLIYSKGYFKDPMWEKVIQLLNLYHNSYQTEATAKYLTKINDDTLYDFARNTSETPYKRYGDQTMTRSEIREVFAFVKENNYPLFNDFYECNARSLGL